MSKLRRRCAPVLGLALLLAPLQAARATGGARADLPVMRVGSHPGYGRVVFDLPSGVSAGVEVAGASVVVRFSSSEVPAVSSKGLTNLLGASADAGRAVLTIAGGVRVRESRLPGRLVLDLLDPSLRTDPRPEPQKAERQTPPAPTDISGRAARQTVVQPPPQSPAAPTPPPATVLQHPDPRPDSSTAAAVVQQPLLAPQEPGSAPADAPTVPEAPGAGAVAQAVDPLSLSVVPLASAGANDQATHAVRIPISPDAGAAAFHSGSFGIVVFDQRRPLDLSPMRDDAVFGQAFVKLLPSATLLEVPLAPPETMTLRRARDSWELAIANRPPRLVELQPEPAGSAIRVSTKTAHAVVSIPDPQTGGTLLLGTQSEAGEAVRLARTTPEFSLIQSEQGVVVAPSSDRLEMHATDGGFIISQTGGVLSLPASAERANSAALSRRFDWPALPEAELEQRMAVARAAAAAAPPRSRLRERVALAEAMLPLGLGAEAQGLLQTAAQDAPQDANDPDLVALSAIAALLNDRPNESAGINDPRLTGTDEIALWRAVRMAAVEPASPAAAAVFASDIGLVTAYPAPLRDRMWPRVLETMAAGGQADAVSGVLATPQQDPSLEFARLAALEHQSRPAADLTPIIDGYDRLADGVDRRVRALAAVRAVELRLISGRTTPAAAADALDSRRLAWRGGEDEPALLERIAELRRQAGDPRAAVRTLRDVERDWPERRERVQGRLSEIFGQAVSPDAKPAMSPLDLVAFVEENPDLVPQGEAGRRVAAEVADRLVALDLPKRVLPILTATADATSAGPARAEIGARIAELDLRAHNPAAALTALAHSDAADLPQAAAERRGLARARAEAASGHFADATSILAAIGSPAADELRAQLCEDAKDWPDAVAALRSYAATSIPKDGALTDAQGRTVLRLAADAAEAGDEKALAEIRTVQLARLPEGGIRDTVTALAGAPFHGAADLPAVAREAALVGTMPRVLETMFAVPPRPPAATR